LFFENLLSTSGFAVPPSPCAVCLFFKLDQYQEILMSISTTRLKEKQQRLHSVDGGVCWGEACAQLTQSQSAGNGINQS
jgi:hypothetical protein